MSANEVDAYFAALEAPKRSTLEEMRRRILDIIPDAEQTLSYAVPAFKVNPVSRTGGRAAGDLVKARVQRLPSVGKPARRW